MSTGSKITRVRTDLVVSYVVRKLAAATFQGTQMSRELLKKYNCSVGPADQALQGQAFADADFRFDSCFQPGVLHVGLKVGKLPRNFIAESEHC